ncbi:Hypothetical predicted protein [Paramuricea clavata]|uniref:Uncharacterized protein n=1 Tax=Paramuricea clavata TaxID=317549 RepID=A0A6S7FPK6_PARCT|nr:Hypothetical predicted protein [Paramuricea clavata]
MEEFMCVQLKSLELEEEYYENNTLYHEFWVGDKSFIKSDSDNDSIKAEYGNSDSEDTMNVEPPCRSQTFLLAHIDYNSGIPYHAFPENNRMSCSTVGLVDNAIFSDLCRTIVLFKTIETFCHTATFSWTHTVITVRHFVKKYK